MFVVSFATADYIDEIVPLVKDLDALKIPQEIRIIPKMESWNKATFYKAGYVRSMLLKHQRPVVWIDADMEIRQFPEIFDQMEQRPSCTPDIAYAMFQDKLNSTCVFFNDTPEAHAILNRWEKNNQEFPENSFGDQENLEKAVHETPEARVFILPPEYAMFDLCKNQDNPVLWGRQASRRHR
jgi:hypothetical protein